jgi:hypothetical protein
VGRNLAYSHIARAIIIAVSDLSHTIGIVFVRLAAQDEPSGDVLTLCLDVVEAGTAATAYMNEKSVINGLRSSPSSLCKYVAAIRPVLTTCWRVSFDDGAERPVVNAFELDNLFERQHPFVMSEIWTYNHGSDFSL